MRILQVGASYTGAQKKIELGIHNYLKKNNYESYILYSYGESNDPNIIRYENKFENILRRAIVKIGKKSTHCAFVSTLHLVNLIRKINPDVVHLHVIHHGYIDFIMLFKYLIKQNIPVVYTMHDMWAFTGGCYHFCDINCEGYKYGCRKCPKKMNLDCNNIKTGKMLMLKQNLYDKLDHLAVVSVSNWVDMELSNSILKDKIRYVVQNGLDNKELNEIIYKSQKSYKRFKIIGVASVWTKEKGIDKFFELGEKLGEEYEITLVGDVDSALEQKAPNNIIFTGKILDTKKLYDLYRDSNIHVSMSTEETFGMTFVEAAYLGIKSIGFDSTAISEIINQTYGYLVQSQNINQMILVIKRLNENRIECALSNEEICKIKEHFSMDNMAQKYTSIYVKQLQNRDERTKDVL